MPDVAGNYVLVRLHKATAHMLRETARLWMERGNWQADGGPSPDRDMPSYDDIVQELLTRDVAHRQRSRVSSKRRTARRQMARAAKAQEPK